MTRRWTPGGWVTRALLASLTFVMACAQNVESSTPPSSPTTCLSQAEIDAHKAEVQRLSEAAHEARREAEALERELEADPSNESRTETRNRINDLRTEAGVYFGVADKHYFAAEDLQAECEAARRR